MNRLAEMKYQDLRPIYVIIPGVILLLIVITSL